MRLAVHPGAIGDDSYGTGQDLTWTGHAVLGSSKDYFGHVYIISNHFVLYFVCIHGGNHSRLDFRTKLTLHCTVASKDVKLYRSSVFLQ